MSYTSVGQLDQFQNLVPVRKTLGDIDILIIRDGDTVYASSADCPHKGAPLEDGAVCRGKLVCPWHKAAFDIATSDVCEPPALTGLTRYKVDIKDGDILVDTNSGTNSTDNRQNRLTAITENAHVVIIGAGAAGSAALQTLVNNRFHGDITVIDPDIHAPYDRTLLTKAIPAGEMEPEDISALTAEEALRHSKVTRMMSPVAAIDVQAQNVRLQDGQTVSFDRLVIASGGIASRPDVPGAHLSGIHTLRNVEQTESLLDDIDNTNSITIIGNSFIGLEMAASLRQRSERIRIRVIAPDAIPFEHQFGTQVGQYFRELHERHNIEFIEDSVEAFTGSEKVTGVKLASGKTAESDLVLLATGIKTDTDMMKSLSLTDNGLVEVNEYLQAAENIYAVGDITRYPYQGTQLHIEHWRLAQQHGRHVAQNIFLSLGAQSRQQVFDKTPYFWTKQYDDKFEYVGHADTWDEIEAIGAPQDEQYLAVFRKEGKVIAALAKGYPELTAKMVIEMDDHVSLASVKTEIHAA